MNKQYTLGILFLCLIVINSRSFTVSFNMPTQQQESTRHESPHNEQQQGSRSSQRQLPSASSESGQRERRQDSIHRRNTREVIHRNFASTMNIGGYAGQTVFSVGRHDEE